MKLELLPGMRRAGRSVMSFITAKSQPASFDVEPLGERPEIELSVLENRGGPIHGGRHGQGVPQFPGALGCIARQNGASLAVSSGDLRWVGRSGMSGLVNDA